MTAEFNYVQIFLCHECGRTVRHYYPSDTLPQRECFHWDHYVIMAPVYEGTLKEQRFDG